ncbi:quinone-dependent dihydroorotate dehydrogenase [Oecophyllibacter saccharovorans]|uniref:Dihydroorotate dehydrogenase (quinone) n=1 Tax=Oecophyllibacter saccharovorans TaxID=2558360 RepID=A0A506ULG0_9PROT|nr:quinone-dependent dihydroorotate dehydrogenase [Oecophyllibacter saccharovorans]QDH15365.1 quinone-dependent dihydroorotate dehydrogenase [Oecophyllibacter saccharovorans]TPW34197.1 quinone-dependent dihydroorotate dehydrogenase [Oecophyllibacter saccharovorans]
MMPAGKMATWLLRRLDPELAHEIAIRSIAGKLAGQAPTDDPTLASTVMGLHFPNPIGLAAGFDKNARAIQGLARLGFGFIEVGTVTPLPQPGNPRPRIFRLPADEAIINRMGFNSCGIEAFCRNLVKFFGPRGKSDDGLNIPLGINLGINKTGADPMRDYPLLVKCVSAFADYITINLSSPNTPGLRDLQGPAILARILEAILETVPNPPPLVVKLSPDLENSSYAPIVDAAAAHGAAGLILTNTTLARPEGLMDTRAVESGGLSGRPLANRARAVLRLVAQANQGRLALISAGGVDSGRDVFERLCLGADLVQIYTAFIYHGPEAISRIKAELLAIMRITGLPSITAIRQAVAEGRLSV